MSDQDTVQVPKGCSYRPGDYYTGLNVTNAICPGSIVMMMDSNMHILGVLDTSFVFPFLSSAGQPVYGISPVPDAIADFGPKSLLTSNGLIVKLTTYPESTYRPTLDENPLGFIYTGAYELSCGDCWIANPGEVVVVELLGEVPQNWEECLHFLDPHPGRVHLCGNNRIQQAEWYSKLPDVYRGEQKVSTGAGGKTLTATGGVLKYDDGYYGDLEFNINNNKAQPKEFCAMLTLVGYCPDNDTIPGSCTACHDVCYDQIFSTCAKACNRLHLSPEIKNEWISHYQDEAKKQKQAILSRIQHTQQNTVEDDLPVDYNPDKTYGLDELEPYFIKPVLTMATHSKMINNDAYHCSICIGQFCEGEELIFLACLHNFHSDCLLSWLNEQYDKIHEKVAAEKRYIQQQQQAAKRNANKPTNNNNNNNSNSTTTQHEKCQKNVSCPTCEQLIIVTALKQQASISFRETDDGCVDIRNDLFYNKR